MICEDSSDEEISPQQDKPAEQPLSLSQIQPFPSANSKDLMRLQLPGGQDQPYSPESVLSFKHTIAQKGTRGTSTRMVETTEPAKENINPNANAEFEVDEFSANIVKSSQLR